MSQQNGVFPSLASIEAAPPTHGSETRSTTSSLSHSHPSTSYNSSTRPHSSISNRSGTISTRVHIPKLSAATTELLARIAGNIKGTQQTVLRDAQTPISLDPSPSSLNQNTQNSKTRRAGTMRFSSIIIELPEPPFVYPTRVETPAVAPSPASESQPSFDGVNGAVPEPAGLVSTASKPSVPPLTSTAAPAGPQVPEQTQLPSNQLPSSNDLNEPSIRPANSTNAALNPTVPLPAPLPGPLEPEEQAQVRPRSEQALPSDAINSVLGNHSSTIISSKPAVLYPTPTQLPAGPPAHTLSPAHRTSSDNNHDPSAKPDDSVNINRKSLVVDLCPAPAPVLQVSTGIQTSSSGLQPPPRRPSAPLAPLARAPIVLKVPSSYLLKLSTTAPAKSIFTASQRRGSGIRKSGVNKRKRGHDSDGEGIIRAVDSSSDESDIAPTATQTTSGRQVKRPSLYVPSPLTPALPRESSGLIGTSDRAKGRKQGSRKVKSINIRCVYCERGHSLSSNTIVFCDGCNRPWHQHCHDPPIENEVIAVKEKEWFCRECKPMDIAMRHPTIVRSNPSLASKPPVHPPLTIPKTEVGGERFPTDDRRRFLSTLSHAALVELLLTVSNDNPAVPMFPGNMGLLPSSNFAASQAIVKGTTATATSLPTNGADPTPTAVPIVNGQPTTDVASGRTDRINYRESSEDDSDYGIQDHRLYPRVGNGVRLSTNEEDLDILREDPTCSTFSYALHTPASAVIGNVSA
ncbi:hypothetical protein BDW74DRAFT_143197 [Aspergillus multicolor]|uniref:uncharacterized protein n=1 Tax=Aspergillus multicolor TaxID=41759 RepID=UPI003CCDE64E